MPEGATIESQQYTKEGSASLDVLREINSLNRSIRVIEEKLDNTRKKVQINEENMVSINKKQSEEIRLINSELIELKRDIEEIKEKIRLIVKELKLTAKLEDVKLIQKYLEFWEPVNFITRNEFEKRIEELKNQ